MSRRVLRGSSVRCCSARERGARLLVLPESALGGYLREPGPEESAPDIPAGLDPDGPEIARLIELAGDVVVCAGYTEAGDGVLYASAVCVSGDGVLGRQRKVHLPPAERFAYTAGDGFAAFDTPVGRLGMLLCYDKLFPEAARALALDGAEVLCSLSAWPVDRMHPAAAHPRRRPDPPLRPLRPDARGREPGLRGVGQPDRALGAAALPRLGQGRRPRAAPCSPPPAPMRGSRSPRSISPRIREIRLGIDHLADRRPDAYAPPLPAATALGFAR